MSGEIPEAAIAEANRVLQSLPRDVAWAMATLMVVSRQQGFRDGANRGALLLA